MSTLANAGDAEPVEPAIALDAGPPCDPKVGWVTVDEGTFTMRVPCDLKPKEAEGIDSQVGKFESTSLHLSYDYGMYSDPLTSDSGASRRVTHESVNGLPAVFVTQAGAPGGAFPFAAGVHFPKAGQRQGIKLTVWVECATPAAQATAKKIFRSIRFTKR